MVAAAAAAVVLAATLDDGATVVVGAVVVATDAGGSSNDTGATSFDWPEHAASRHSVAAHVAHGVALDHLFIDPCPRTRGSAAGRVPNDHPTQFDSADRDPENDPSGR